MFGGCSFFLSFSLQSLFGASSEDTTLLHPFDQDILDLVLRILSSFARFFSHFFSGTYLVLHCSSSILHALVHSSLQCIANGNTIMWTSSLQKSLSSRWNCKMTVLTLQIPPLMSCLSIVLHHLQKWMTFDSD